MANRCESVHAHLWGLPLVWNATYTGQILDLTSTLEIILI